MIWKQAWKWSLYL